MSTSLPPYHYEIDGERKLLRLSWPSDKRDIPLNPLNSDYCDFLTWLAEDDSRPKGISLGSFRTGVWYVATIEQLVEYLKNWAQMLFVSPRVDGTWSVDISRDDSTPQTVVQHATNARVGDADNLKIVFHPLYRAAAPMRSQGTSQDGVVRAPLAMMVCDALVTQINEQLRDEDSELRMLSTWPIERTFVYFDVSDFSTRQSARQALMINQLIALTREPVLWSNQRANLVLQDLKASLSIGDGYIFVFTKPFNAVFFAAYLACLVEEFVAHKVIDEMHFRAGVHTGPVYRFFDKSAAPGPERWNYVGQGINDGQRVLSAIRKDQDDVVFVSADTRSHLRAPGYADVMRELQTRGRRADKHGEMRRLYELNHTAWAGAFAEGIVDEFKRGFLSRHHAGMSWASDDAF